jgi:cytochrome c-type biogenesis protein CcmH
MKPSFLRLTAILVLLSSATAHANLESFDFSGPVSEQRYRALIEQLRCLVCQNESLEASNAELAGDLRKEIYEMMAKGQSDQKVIDFLIARYGDFVLYNPPLKPSTYFLWFGPFALFILAGFALYRSIHRRSLSVETQLTEEEQARVNQVLGKFPTSREQGR